MKKWEIVSHQGEVDVKTHLELLLAALSAQKDGEGVVHLRLQFDRPQHLFYGRLEAFDNNTRWR